MNFSFLKDAVSQIPPEIKYFLKRAIIIFIVWQLLYYLVLYPTQVPDKQLTQATAWSTGFLYQHILDKNTEITFKNKPNRTTVVYLNNQPSIGIADGCDGLGLYVLYVSILFCFMAPLKRKIIFSLAGCISIFILNGIRCFLLTWLYNLRVPYFDFAHHYIFTMIIYVFIFFMWMMFIKKMQKDFKQK